MVFNTQLEAMEKFVTPKPIPVILPEIGIGVKVTLINTITP
jgi:hypothetical protein